MSTNLHLLSSREYDVFKRLAKGDRIISIADALKLSAATISTYRRRILTKLNLENNAQLVQLSIKGEK